MSDTSTARIVPGTLYVVATTIGNLGDLTVRARDVLAAVDTVLAEDTRVSATLLAHYGITTPMRAVHEHNEARRSAWIVERLRDQQSLALISDAGTPAISDPGARVVREVRDAGLPVVPIPGPSALAAALSVAGVEGAVLFLGFLAPRGAARRAMLHAHAGTPAALVLYEAPHRVRDTLADLAEVLGGARGVLIARELTKRFEEIVRTTLAGSTEWLDADSHRERGEFVLIVEAAPAADAKDTHADALPTLHLLLDELPLAQAVRLAQRLSGAPRNWLYQQALSYTRPEEP